jgi:hypothetical protein
MSTAKSESEFERTDTYLDIDVYGALVQDFCAIWLLELNHAALKMVGKFGLPWVVKRIAAAKKRRNHC